MEDKQKLFRLIKTVNTERGGDIAAFKFNPPAQAPGCVIARRTACCIRACLFSTPMGG